MRCNMKYKLTTPFKTLDRFERWLLGISLILVLASYLLSADKSPLSLIASLVGATALIFVAKGLPIGQVLVIIFSLLYGAVSLQTRYYGEMITYVGMSLPMAVASLVSWIKNPYEKGKGEVKVASLTAKKVALLSALAILVTVAFYFILGALNTPRLVVSTVSVLTSFVAAGLTFLRSPYYALAYASNDVVLIILWVAASVNDISYLPMVMCFAVFLANDIYGYISWQRMKTRQSGK